MFKNLNDFLSGKASLEIDSKGEPTSKELQVATVTLMADAARASGGVSSDELKRVLGSLFREFGLSDYEGSELLEISDFVAKDRSKIERLISAIDKHFTVDQKQRVLSLVWRVIVADGQVDKFEGTFAAELRKKLNLTLEQALRAQKLANEVEIPVSSVSEVEE